jgi:hypothetical protein
MDLEGARATELYWGFRDVETIVYILEFSTRGERALWACPLTPPEVPLGVVNELSDRPEYRPPCTRGTTGGFWRGDIPELIRRWLPPQFPLGKGGTI